MKSIGETLLLNFDCHMVHMSFMVLILVHE